MMVPMVASRLVPAALTAEIGTPGGVQIVAGGTDLWETTPELQWPLNLRVFDRMRKTDTQQRAILSAIKLPVRRTRWRIPETAGVDPRVRAFVERELGLQADDQGRYRSRPGGVDFAEFLRHALLSLDFGHMVFEQVYELGRSDVDGIGFQVAHLRKLGERMPRTLAGFDVLSSGQLAGVKQWIARGTTEVMVTMPVETLVVFSHEREGADWAGQSVMRTSYKNWMIKDAMIRLGALAGERTGMGLPVVTYPKSAAGGGSNDEAKAIRIASAIRSGDEAGVALQEGWTVELLGVKGAVTDLLPWVKYHDEQASKGTLEMFLDLGHDAGARALGDTFVDYFMMAEGALVQDLQSVITEHVIRDLVRINFGPDEAYPPIVADDLNTDSTTTAVALQQLEAAGILIPDQPLEDDIRRRYNLPAADPETRRQPAGVGGYTPGAIPPGTVIVNQQGQPVPAAPTSTPPGTAPAPRVGPTDPAGRPVAGGGIGSGGVAQRSPSPAPGSARPRLVASAGQLEPEAVTRARVAFEQIRAAHGLPPLPDDA